MKTKSLSERFVVAGGSTIGRWHREMGRNNQDAFHIEKGGDAIVAVVCDGCGSSPHSEIGAELGAHIVAGAVMEQARKHAALPEEKWRSDRFQIDFWETVWRNVADKIKEIVTPLPGNMEQVVVSHFLFTIVGVLIAEQGTIFFSIGDGFYGVNDTSHELGPFENNAPPYIVYGELIGPELLTLDPALAKFKISAIVPTEEVESAFIATDGFSYLSAAENKMIPGKNKPAGPASRFWTEDRYLKPFVISRELGIVNRDVYSFDRQTGKIVVEKGHLLDDTTVVVVRLIPRSGTPDPAERGLGKV